MRFIEQAQLGAAQRVQRDERAGLGFQGSIDFGGALLELFPRGKSLGVELLPTSERGEKALESRLPHC